jgi:hypothetical protein
MHGEKEEIVEKNTRLRSFNKMRRSVSLFLNE